VSAGRPRDGAAAVPLAPPPVSVAPSPTDRARRRRAWLRIAVDASAVALALGFLASYFPADVMLAPTTTNGGDMGTHFYPAAFLREHLLPHARITGWCPGNYGGYPLFQLYFPLPFVLIGLLASVVPLTIAFKLVTVLGVFALPPCAYASLRLARVPFPGPALAALACLPFLFMEANSMWGGNIPSTLAGEFPLSLGLALSVLFLGALRRTVDSGGGRIATGLLVAAIGLSHGYTLVWAGCCSLAELVALRGWWRRLGALVAIHGLAILVMAFWLVPLVGYAAWTTAYAHSWHLKGWQEMLPPILWPPAVVAGATLVAVAIGCLVRRRPFPRPLAQLWFATALGVAFYFVATAVHLVDIRFFPFLQLGLCLTAAAGVAYLVAWLPAAEVWPLAVALVLLPFVQAQVTYIPTWIHWNYSGFERKAPWPTLHAIAEHLRGTFADPRVVYEHSPDHEAMGTIRVFENLPLFAGRSTLEGLYMQAGPTSPFVFYVQSEISQVTSCPLPQWGCARPNLARGVDHLRLFDVSHYIVKSETMKRAARRQPGLVHEATFAGYEIYRVAENDPRYALPLAVAPVLIETSAWKEDAYRWFKTARPGDPVPVFVPAVDAEARALFGAPSAGLPDALPVRALGPAPTTHEEMPTPERLVVTGLEPGRPVLVRISYHSRWRTTSGERVWLAAPSFMLVVPRGDRLELVYDGGWPDTIGTAMSVLGWLLVAAAVLPAGRRLGRRIAAALARGPLGAGGRLIAWTGTWSMRVRLAVLVAGVLAVPAVFVAGALASRSRDAAALLQSGQALVSRGRLDDALVALREAQEPAPLSRTAMTAVYLEASVLRRKGDAAGAERAYRRLAEEFPEAPTAAEALYQVGVLRLARGDRAGAVAAWRETRRRWPGTPPARNARARLAEPPA
jgi:hypothetical protein